MSGGVAGRGGLPADARWVNVISLPSLTVSVPDFADLLQLR